MSTTSKLQAGATMPKITLPKAGGGQISIGGQPEWQMVVVYRGKHCPLCKKYLGTLNGLVDDFANNNVALAVVSGDPKEKAEAEVAEEKWRFPVGYGLTPEQMRTLGLYISEPRSPQETDRLFPEPGLFVVNPDGRAHIVDVSNAPFARPDLASVLNGIKFIREKNYPIRGTAA